MPVSLIEGDSLLAVDIGAATTRAVLFDVVEGQYRFVASGHAPSTAEAPFKDVSEGVRNAIAHLQSVIARPLLDANRGLISPTQSDGSGVDAFVATMSAGPTLKAVIVGLLSDVSLESARRLTETIYARVVDSISLADHRRPDAVIDSLLHSRPEVVVVTGGTDGGASRSIQKLLEPVGLANYLMPAEKRPAVLFAGNQKMESEVKTLLGSLTSSLHFSPNVRPSLETEDLDPAARELARLFVDVRKQQLKGVDVIDAWANGHVLPTGYATGRMMRFLSRVYGSAKGILSVDIGASAALIAAGFEGKSTLNVYPQFGLGENLPALLNYTTLEDILRWSPLDISTGSLRDYLYQKSLYPSAIPGTKEDQAISQSIARQALYLSMQSAKKDFPRSAAMLKPGLLPLFDPILAGGGALSDAPTPGHSLLLLLDSLQPVGVTTVILDQNNLLPILGAAAGRNNLLPVQVLDSGAFMSVGTVVSPVVSASYGTQILRARLSYEDGTEARADLKFGTLELLPLPSGQAARLTLQPSGRADVGFGPGRSGTVSVSGGTLGVVFDGRGRPLDLPSDAVRRRELIKKWYWTLGG
ncbi:MAG TPA: glutamate mutase L [Anaerolineales bacterium]|nr:glutamate mutase L [Anaerolineales bacterium]